MLIYMSWFWDALGKFEENLQVSLIFVNVINITHSIDLIVLFKVMANMLYDAE